MRLQPYKIEHHTGQMCPHCCSVDTKKKKGILIEKKGKFGSFLGCSLYPNCCFSCKIGNNLENQANALLKKKKKTRRGKKKKPAWVQQRKKEQSEAMKQYKKQRKERWLQYQEFRRQIS